MLSTHSVQTDAQIPKKAYHKKCPCQISDAPSTLLSGIICWTTKSIDAECTIYRVEEKDR